MEMILKQPVEVLPGVKQDHVFCGISSQHGYFEIRKAIIDDLFRPFSREQTQQQIEEILHEFSCVPRGKTYTPSQWSGRIVSLLFGEAND